MTTIQTAALDQWLHSVWQLLVPLHPVSLTLLRSTGRRARIEWFDEAVPAELVVRAYPSPDAAPGVGWLMDMGSRKGGELGLLLCTSPTIPRGSPGLALAASLCRASYGLLWPDPGNDADEGADEHLHELRNALNCAAMSAALLAGPQLPAELRGHAEDTKNGVSRSIKALSKLADHLRD